jgi:hypothetical protein
LRVSASSAASTSSGLTSGFVRPTGSRSPSFSFPAFGVPGSSATDMSLSPVFGRSSIVASR